MGEDVRFKNKYISIMRRSNPQVWIEPSDFH